MSLMRAFTTRRNKPDMELPNMSVFRAASHRKGRPVLRSQISSPVALLSSTNMQSYEAPNIAGCSPIEAYGTGPSSISDSSSDEDSDSSMMSHDKNGDMTDASSVDSPIDPSPEPNHLSCYFNPSVDTKTSSRSLSRSPSTSTRASFDAPAIPRRVPSHSKKAHESMHRKHSLRRMMSPPASIRSSGEVLSSAKSSFIEPASQTSFGNELAQLDEVAEELSHVVEDADVVAMEEHHLAHFSASDYLCEIETLIQATFTSDPDDNMWI